MISSKVQNSRKDYRKGDARSSSNRLSATPAELRSRRITAATASTKHLDGLGRAPVERRRADRNPAPPAEFGARGILVPATRADSSTRFRRRGLHISGDRLESRIAAASAELHAFRKTRLTFRTHDDRQRARRS